MSFDFSIACLECNVMVEKYRRKKMKHGEYLNCDEKTRKQFIKDANKKIAELEQAIAILKEYINTKS